MRSSSHSPVAYLDLRIVRRRYFINHIWTSAELRGSGIGSQLLRAGLTRNDSASGIGLDVAAENLSAIRWYKRLGLSETSRTDWLVREVRPAKKVGILSHHMVEASLSKFGMATAFLEDGRRMDMLASGVVRIPERENTSSTGDDLGDRVAASFPFVRSILVTQPAGTDQIQKDFNIAHTSIRMHGRMKDAIDSLRTV